MNDHHYAVVVGINRYPGLSDLTGARADAQAFAEWLESPDGGGLPADNIRRVMASDAEEAAFGNDAGAAKPIREQIEDAIGELAHLSATAVQADPTVWPRTRLYLYVAGHGLAPSGGEGALYLANAREGAARNLELTEYRKWCTRCACVSEVVMFSDCCRTRTDTARALAPTLDDCAAPLNGGRPTTWVVGYGSGVGDPTYESDARGYFTSALIEGLRDAPTEPDGAVTAATLGPFVKTLVAERTKNKRFPQSVEMFADAGTRVIFRAQPPPAAATLQVTLTFGGYAGRVQLLGATLDVLGTHDAATGDWQLPPLAPGAYGVRPEPGQPEPQLPFANNGLFWATQDGERVEL